MWEIKPSGSWLNFFPLTPNLCLSSRWISYGKAYSTVWTSTLDVNRSVTYIFLTGFWMSDKPLVQQALATELANIVLAIPDAQGSLNFLRGFWRTTVREWAGIDRLRFVSFQVFDIAFKDWCSPLLSMDKFYMLVRRFVNASFRLLTQERWKTSLVDHHNLILDEQGGPLWWDLCQHVDEVALTSRISPTDQRVPVGLIYHISDVYLEELDRALAGTKNTHLDQDQLPLSKLVSPWLPLLSRVQATSTHRHITDHVLVPLLDALSSGNETFHYVVESVGDIETTRRALLQSLFDTAGNVATTDTNRRKLYQIYRAYADDDDDGVADPWW